MTLLYVSPEGMKHQPDAWPDNPTDQSRRPMASRCRLRRPLVGAVSAAASVACAVLLAESIAGGAE